MTYGSFYEITNPLTSVSGVRMIEWFTGNDISDSGTGKRWNQQEISGSMSFGCVNEIDGGFNIASNGTINSQNCINWLGNPAPNQKRQFNPSGCSVIGIMKRQTANTNIFLDMVDDYDFGYDVTPNLSILSAQGNDVDYDYYHFHVGNSGGHGGINTDLLIDTEWHTHRMDSNSSNASYQIDGILKATATSRLPNDDTDDLMPRFYVGDTSGSVNNIGKIRYMEAWNH